MKVMKVMKAKSSPPMKSGKASTSKASAPIAVAPPMKSCLKRPAASPADKPSPPPAPDAPDSAGDGEGGQEDEEHVGEGIPGALRDRLKMRKFNKVWDDVPTHIQQEFSEVFTYQSTHTLTLDMMSSCTHDYHSVC